MTAPSCSRHWQAEAAEDRRLSDADRSSFERHAATCASCQLAVRELVRLRGVGPREHEASPLEHRRARNELLRRANELTLGTPPATRFRGLLLAVSALSLAAALAVLVVWRRGQVPPEATVAVPSYDLAASSGADWAVLERGSTVRLATRRGRFELSVRHLSPGQRFLLVLPDGELEVRGTRFVVDVDGNRTLAVRVEEGRVALRVRERGDGFVVLGAGDGFSSATAPTAPTSPPEPSTPKMAPPVPRPPPSTASPPDADAPDTRGESSAERPLEAADAGAEPSGGPEFTRAMGAFSSGNYGEAERMFRAFATRHPTDPRAEDATFLSAVASARRGDPQAARAQARRYLDRYPTGLRRLEAERLAQ